MRRMTASLLFVSALALAPACTQASADPTGNMTQAQIEEIIKSYILDNPEVVEQALINLSRDRQNAELSSVQDKIAEHRTALYEDTSDYSVGPDDAEVTVVEFFDYRCGFCKRSADLIAQIPEEYDGRVRVVFKELPILSDASGEAAMAAIAAGRQGKYLEMHMALMADRSEFTSEDIDRVAESVGVNVDQMRAEMVMQDVQDQISRAVALADELGSPGTPAFFVGNTYIAGANMEGLKAAIEAELQG